MSQKTRKARHSSTNRKQFWLLGAPEDGAEEKRDHVPILRRFGKKCRIRKLLTMTTSIENSKIEVQIVHLQP